jgi:hypothetical protein
MAEDASREVREASPIGADLEFYGNTAHRAHDQLDAPEAGGAIPFLIAGSKGDRLDDGDQDCQVYGELRKEVMEGHRKCKLQAVNQLACH